MSLLLLLTSGGAAASSPRIVQRVTRLAASDFQHPLDREATQARHLLRPLEDGVRQAFGFVEEAYLLDNIATGVLCGPNQLPEYYEMLRESCELLEINPTPSLYVRQSPAPNAYTLAVQGRAPFVVLTTGLLDVLEPIEVQAVIAHELGHLKCEHGLLIALANVLAAAAPDTLSGVAQSRLLRWQRAAELTCDRAALVVVQQPRAVQAVMMKLCGASVKTARLLNVEAFVAQASKRTFDTAAGSALGRQLTRSREESATHPLPILRARELERWASSAEYAKLLSRGAPTELRAAEQLEARLATLGDASSGVLVP